MNQSERLQFLQFYQLYRHKNQLDYYVEREKEYTHAQSQAIWLSIGLIFLAALAGAFEAIPVNWVQFTCLLLAAICPILSTTLAGYNALYAFEQQAKIYRDARQNLETLAVHMPEVQPGQGEAEFAQRVERYVLETELVLNTERGYWGQLAKEMKPLDI
jgi:hypothetical protein